MKSTKVPEPLTFVSSDEAAKIEWIEKRINEVYIAYGKKLPSIAIFLNRKEDVPAFVERLRDTLKKQQKYLEVSRKLSIFAAENPPCMQITWVSSWKAT